MESGGDPTSTRVVAVEFKALDVLVTHAKLRDPDERTRLARALMSRIAEYACAALNARVNMTIYLGVNDDCVVVGVQVEDFSVVRVDGSYYY